jgi:hypothetical protein
MGTRGGVVVDVNRGRREWSTVTQRGSGSDMLYVSFAAL